MRLFRQIRQASGLATPDFNHSCVHSLKAIQHTLSGQRNTMICLNPFKHLPPTYLSKQHLTAAQRAAPPHVTRQQALSCVPVQKQGKTVNTGYLQLPACCHHTFEEYKFKTCLKPHYTTLPHQEGGTACGRCTTLVRQSHTGTPPASACVCV